MHGDVAGKDKKDKEEHDAFGIFEVKGKDGKFISPQRLLPSLVQGQGRCGSQAMMMKPGILPVVADS